MGKNQNKVSFSQGSDGWDTVSRVGASMASPWGAGPSGLLFPPAETFSQQLVSWAAWVQFPMESGRLSLKFPLPIHNTVSHTFPEAPFPCCKSQILGCPVTEAWHYHVSAWAWEFHLHRHLGLLSSTLKRVLIHIFFISPGLDFHQCLQKSDFPRSTRVFFSFV